MKNLLLIITLLTFGIVNSQIIDIPDYHFNYTLLSASPSKFIAKDSNGNFITIDTNNDGKIQLSEADNVAELILYNKAIHNLIGIEGFKNLKFLQCSKNFITSLDLSNNTDLQELHCTDNALQELNLSNVNLFYLVCYNNSLDFLDISDSTDLFFLNCTNNSLDSLDVDNNPNLEYIYCGANNLTTINTNKNPELTYLSCGDNKISVIDVSDNGDLNHLYCNDNNSLHYINLRNGFNENHFLIDYSSFENLPHLQNVCVDNVDSDIVKVINRDVGHPVIYSEHCNFADLQHNDIEGKVQMDMDTNGCDMSDVPIANIMITSTNESESFATFTQDDGNYLLYTNEGDFSTFINANLPDYFTINPKLYNNTFDGFDNVFNADFCVVPNQTINDVVISLIPINLARPGFDVTQQIVYKNEGTTRLNGKITLDFDKTKLSFLDASETIIDQTNKSLTFSYKDLDPFETRKIDVNFHVFKPPTVQIDDKLLFVSEINPISNDNTQYNNIFISNQIVVGSYDPNDILCVEGREILYTDLDKELHYIIRFQNTGNASAINVKINNHLDENLDWKTFKIINSSHKAKVDILGEKDIIFTFKNINLPDSTTDEPNSHGFIAYRIKAAKGILIGTTLENQANILFDFNEPIKTNIATTQIVDNDLSDFVYSVYPVPVTDIIKIKTSVNIQTIQVFNSVGKLLIKNTNMDTINISSLNQGLYIVTIEDEYGKINVRKVYKK